MLIRHSKFFSNKEEEEAAVGSTGHRTFEHVAQCAQSCLPRAATPARVEPVKEGAESDPYKRRPRKRDVRLRHGEDGPVRQLTKNTSSSLPVYARWQKPGGAVPEPNGTAHRQEGSARTAPRAKRQNASSIPPADHVPLRARSKRPRCSAPSSLPRAPRDRAPALIRG